MPARDHSDEVRIAHGPLALENLLERDVRAEHARVRAEPVRLRTPILIVVPSRSLRAHVVRKIAAWCGGAAAGWRVVTLFGLAREACTNSGTTVPRGARLFEPLVDRAVARARELGPTLAGFEDGPRAAAATIADLVDAGFDPELAPALLRELEKVGRSLTAAEGKRVRALVAIAADLVRESETLGVARSAGMLRCAEQAIQSDSLVVRARAIWIHGFADATGAAAGLLDALQSSRSARVYWDACADGRFGEALRKRLSVDVTHVEHSGASPCTLERASSLDVETRGVADRVRALIDAGMAPESIGVVARDLEPYRVSLRRHFERLAIPFSGQSASAPDGPAGRHAKALAECVSKGDGVPTDRWLDARAEASFAAHRSRPYELRIAMRALGVATLGELAALDVDAALEGRAALALPLRGITTVENCDVDEEGSDTEREDEPAIEGPDTSKSRNATRRVALTKRSVDRADLMREVDLAKVALQALEAPGGRGTVGARSAELRILASGALGWETDSVEMRIFDEAIASLTADLPADMALDEVVVSTLIEREIIARAGGRIGGAGAGVACLNVVEARGRTFDALFVMGLVRGRFPRNVREDPLLSDTVRSAWTAVLPHMPVKSVGRDEERVLFDQLVRSAPAVHLSWITLDAENKALLPSPLLERVASHAEIAAVPLAADPLTQADPDSRAVRPAHEHAVTAALHDRIDGLSSVLPIALSETRALFGLDANASQCARLADARIAILREHEPRPGETAALGPYFGMIGKLAVPADLRSGDLHVTQLEAIAACGWKALLMRVLRIEPALDPLDMLPDLDARLVGDVVHAVLQRVVDAMKSNVRWPAHERVEELLHQAAHAKLRERGTFVPGFETLVATRARPMLDAARALDEDEAQAIRSARSEVDGRIDLPEGALGPRKLLFRADRVDELDADGETAARFTDYKTGKPISNAQRVDTRSQHLLKAVARGKSLQAMAYALGAGASGSGRYVFLREELEAEKRIFELRADDAQAAEAFHDALERIVGALDMGVLFPRLLDADTHRTNGLCASCEMAQACLRGDSGANLRLARFVRAQDQADVAQQAALALWSLASAEVAT